MRENLNPGWPFATGTGEIPELSATHPEQESSQPAKEFNPVADEDFLPEEAENQLADWKAILRRDFEAWLSSIEQIPEEDAGDFEMEDAPDLYTFYEQFASGNAEVRKANRRTAEAFSQWGETLSRFHGDLRLLREQMARLPTAKEGALPRPWCLSLAEVLDRAQRLAAAFKTPPRKPWWIGNDPLRKAWETQGQGLEILVSHLERKEKKIKER